MAMAFYNFYCYIVISHVNVEEINVQVPAGRNALCQIQISVPG